MDLRTKEIKKLKFVCAIVIEELRFNKILSKNIFLVIILIFHSFLLVIVYH